MNTIAWIMIAYVVVDRVLTVALVGTSWKITPSAAVLSLITGGLLVWGVVSLAGAS